MLDTKTNLARKSYRLVLTFKFCIEEARER